MHYLPLTETVQTYRKRNHDTSVAYPSSHSLFGLRRSVTSKGLVVTSE